MTGGIDLSIVVPAYNEANRIEETLKAIVAYLRTHHSSFEVIVVADGNDGTREKAEKFAAQSGAPVQVTGSVSRRGKGRGIREGIALSHGQIVGFVDADYKTPIEEVEKLLPWLNSGYDVVIGSRAQSDSRVEIAQPLYRRVGSRVFGIAMHLTTGLWQIRDTQCGFKFFQGPVARDLFGRQKVDGYMFDVEVLCLAHRSGYRIREVGVRWRDDGDSRLDLVAGNWQNMIDILRISLSTPPRLLTASKRAGELVGKPNEGR
ncbi:MAG TPA: dolichyl-phosphate beta-glucosyltransferase [Polyangiaceae bacterium]|jgi:dolichyl-phosphate beta-glucosyltransferase|nr:dolichyl-phosphate beta-glucosyltransferase [Polyangiaceae bacterium]